MAAVMSVAKLQALLSEAVARGAVAVWSERGSLVLGPHHGRPDRRIDFAAERLVPVSGGRQPQGRGTVTAAADAPFGPALALLDAPPVPGRTTGNLALILEGKVLHAQSHRALLLSTFREIERLRPGTLDKLASEKKRTKRAVARSRDLLYDKPRLAKHAERIEGGWWVATNNSANEVETFVRRAAFHAGLHVEIRRAPRA